MLLSNCRNNTVCAGNWWDDGLHYNYLEDLQQSKQVVEEFCIFLGIARGEKALKSNYAVIATIYYVDTLDTKSVRCEGFRFHISREHFFLHDLQLLWFISSNQTL